MTKIRVPPPAVQSNLRFPKLGFQLRNLQRMQDRKYNSYPQKTTCRQFQNIDVWTCQQTKIASLGRKKLIQYGIQGYPISGQSRILSVTWPSIQNGWLKSLFLWVLCWFHSEFNPAMFVVQPPFWFAKQPLLIVFNAPVLLFQQPHFHTSNSQSSQSNHLSMVQNPLPKNSGALNNVFPRIIKSTLESHVLCWICWSAGAGKQFWGAYNCVEEITCIYLILSNTYLWGNASRSPIILAFKTSHNSILRSHPIKTVKRPTVHT